MVFAQFVVPEPKLQEQTRNELNMSFGANGMTWVLRKIQMQLFSYQKWLERSSRTVFAQFVVPEPKPLEQTRNELKISLGANGGTWVLIKTQMQLFCTKSGMNCLHEWFLHSLSYRNQNSKNRKRAKHEF